MPLHSWFTAMMSASGLTSACPRRLMYKIGTVQFRYLPISTIEENWGLYVTTAGHSVIQPGSEYPPTKHPSAYHFTWQSGRILDEFQVVYITAGGGQFETRKTRKTIEPGSLIFLHPGVWHRYRPNTKTGWTEYRVGFKGDVAGRWAEHDFIPREPYVVRIGIDGDIVEQYQRLVRDAEDQYAGYQQEISARVAVILARILTDIKRGSVSGSQLETIIKSAKAIMAEHLDGELDVEELAEQFNMSYTSFRRAFKRLTNLAPNQYYVQLRISRAKELLRSTDLPTKNIASILGFSNPQYLWKVFRKHTGQSPQDFRPAGK